MCVCACVYVCVYVKNNTPPPPKASLTVAQARLLRVLQPEQRRHRRAEDVRVEDARAVALTRKGQREVRGDGRLAYAAFGRGDGDYFAHRRDAPLRGQAALHAWERGRGTFAREALECGALVG